MKKTAKYVATFLVAVATVTAFAKPKTCMERCAATGGTVNECFYICNG